MDILFTCFLAWAFAQFIKGFIHLLKKKEWSWNQALASGSFPSAHSSFMTCLVFQLGAKEGFQSSVFILALAIWAVVIYDSYNVRYSVGIQAQLLNKMGQELKESMIEDFEPTQEILGHTRFEVAAGICLGLLIALIRLKFFPFA